MPFFIFNYLCLVRTRRLSSKIKIRVGFFWRVLPLIPVPPGKIGKLASNKIFSTSSANNNTNYSSNTGNPLSKKKYKKKKKIYIFPRNSSTSFKISPTKTTKIYPKTPNFWMTTKNSSVLRT